MDSTVNLSARFNYNLAKFEESYPITKVKLPYPTNFLQLIVYIFDLFPKYIETSFRL